MTHDTLLKQLLASSVRFNIICSGFNKLKKYMKQRKAGRVRCQPSSHATLHPSATHDIIDFDMRGALIYSEQEQGDVPVACLAQGMLWTEKQSQRGSMWSLFAHAFDQRCHMWAPW